MNWIIACLAILLLVACDADKKPTPAPAARTADAGKGQPGSAQTKTNASKPVTPEPADNKPDGGAVKAPPTGGGGILPEPDFKLSGPDLKAPSSAPSGEEDQPKLLDLDLKKE